MGIGAHEQTVGVAALGMIALCALAATFTIMRRELLAERSHEAAIISVPEWRAVAAVGHRRGPGDARAVVVEFADFQCPYCRSFEAVLEPLRAKYPDDLAIVFRHLPLSTIHAQAAGAAIAAECAGRQGRFDQYRAKLFAYQDSLNPHAWELLAARANVPDTLAFRGCVERRETATVIEADVRAADRLGINGTPTDLVNDKLFVRPPSLKQLDTIVHTLSSKRRQGPCRLPRWLCGILDTRNGA